jgi:uncharacterized protein with NRDE domain
MCLIALAWGASERFPFVIAANRDEYLDRPTAPLAFWQTAKGTQILAGRDLRQGGTWMGFTPSGRFAMLTNVRAPQATPPSLHAQPISRGGLPLAWLESDLPAKAWAQSIEPQRYQGFHLIVGDWPTQQCHHLSNLAQSLPLQQISKPFEQFPQAWRAIGATEFVANELPWGDVYGLSNADLDAPWPKTVQLKAALQASLVSANAQAVMSHNLQALANQAKPLDTDLPSTGVPIEWERALSSALVRHPEDAPIYGTRTSLVAVYEAGAGLSVMELTHGQINSPAQTIQVKLGWASKS